MNLTKLRCFFVKIAGICCICAILGTPSASAEFICGSEVSYKWKKSLPVATPNAKPEGESAGESVVHIASIERRGADQAAAKEALAVEVTRLKVRASESCKREHEGFGVCVSAKFAASSATLNSLGFSARKEMEKALTEECRGQQGSCLGVVSSEPTCREKVEVVPTPPGGEKKTDKKK